MGQPLRPTKTWKPGKLLRSGQGKVVKTKGLSGQQMGWWLKNLTGKRRKT